MNINAEHKIGAIFKLVARKASDDTISRETDWFHNLVLDSGLARMSVGTWINRCCVGTGNSEPLATQVALDSFLASSTTIQSKSAGVNTSIAPYYWFGRRTYRFGAGVATGNISEVGLGWMDNQLWNRALIKDANGNPTTITVLSDEYLDVLCEVRVYPQQSIAGSFNLLDKTGAIVSTHTYTGKPCIYTASWGSDKIVLRATSSADGLHIYSGDLGDSVSASPKGAFAGSGGATSMEYPTPTSIKGTYIVALNNANFSHKSLVIKTNLMASLSDNACGYQMQIDPPIPKTPSTEITYSLTMSWGRYEPT